MDVTIRVPVIEKLVDYTASGIGSIAGPMLATWRARREAAAKTISAQGEADALAILAEAQAGALPVIAEAQDSARRQLAAPGTTVEGEVAITDAIEQRVRFQEEKRQRNISAIVAQAAEHFASEEVEDHEPDHDWTARFFSDAQDVSSADMQRLWARVLAGEVERPGSTSLLTLNVLKNIDRETASSFSRLCSACISLSSGEGRIVDARVLSLTDFPDGSVLGDYGFDFGALNVLREHGLIIPADSSWLDYGSCVMRPDAVDPPVAFRYQGKHWVFIPTADHNGQGQFRLHGVALTRSGRELSSVVDIEPLDSYTASLDAFLMSQGMQMGEVEFGSAQGGRLVTHDQR